MTHDPTIDVFYLDCYSPDSGLTSLLKIHYSFVFFQALDAMNNHLTPPLPQPPTWTISEKVNLPNLSRGTIPPQAEEFQGPISE